MGSKPIITDPHEQPTAGAGAGAGAGADTNAAKADHPTTGSSEAPRPSWVHASTSPEQLLAQAERAVGDRYRIESIAGEGGMGRVFSARDIQLGRRVAIKLLTVLDPNPDEDPGLRAHDRLVAEARAMARLNHPNLCRVIEVSLVGQTPFLVMDWVKGVDLTGFCKSLDTRRRISVLLSVLDAVTVMHQGGLVHGDIKPSNVLVDHDEKPTIVDFGLSRAEADPSWIAAPLGGTPGYAAPELLTNLHEIGPPADVFSLGVMLYELLTGCTPFPRRTAPAVMIDLLKRGAVPLPEHYAPDVPADLQKICLSALEPEPEDRYPDAAAMAADIRRYLRRETVSARPRLLESRFDEQIEQQILQTREWRRLGLITQRETEVVARVLADLQRAESPWIIDARRLRASQVSLYLGGWILAMGLVFGLANSLDTINLTGGQTIGVLIAWGLALLTLVLGLRLQRSGEKRVGVGMLVTAQIALPAALWILLRETGWIAGAKDMGMGAAAELTTVLGGGASPVPGLANAQILAISAAGLAIAGALRYLVRSTAFTFFGVIAAGAVWLALYLVFGGLDDHAPLAIGRWGLWLALLGLATLPAAFIIDAREHDLIREIGRRRAKLRDAAPVLIGSLIWMGLGASAAALLTPGWYFFRAVGGASPDPADQAWAFGVNGLLLASVMVLLDRRVTPLRRRIAGGLRWILPTQLMAPLLIMEIHETFGVWTPWLVLLPVLAVGFCFASAFRQWKPFLISGLVYLAIWYARCFARIDSEFADHTAWKLGMTIAALALGPALMLLAWKAPAWIARRRLRKWELLSALRDGPRAGRSWR